MASTQSLVLCAMFATFSYVSMFTITYPPLLTKAAGCLRNGVMHKPGESFKPSPCEHCQCDTSGHVLCAIQDCMFPACVDSVFQPGKCCPVCPNGPNCRSSDGVLLQAGENRTTEYGDICFCPTTPNRHFGQASALCLKKPQHGSPGGTPAAS